MAQRMSEDDATAEIAILVQASVEPTLTDDEVTYLVSKAKRADLHGTIPSDPAWVPTWEINSAVAKGWELKAGKATPMVNLNLTGSLTASASDIYAHCMAQAKLYASRVFETITVDSRRKKEMLELPLGVREIDPEVLPNYQPLDNE